MYVEDIDKGQFLDCNGQKNHIITTITCFTKYCKNDNQNNTNLKPISLEYMNKKREKLNKNKPKSPTLGLKP